jgi:SAM-dependent methyltransferase
MTTNMSTALQADASGSRGAIAPLILPHPAGRPDSVRWNGHFFNVDGDRADVLGYDVAPSGWTDELTHLHEKTAAEHHFLEVASRARAVDEVLRSVRHTPSVILEVGCSSGFLLQELRSRLPQHVLIGSDYTRGTLDILAQKVSGIPLIQFDLTKCPLPDGLVDIAVLLNVLEHIDDHAAAMRHLFRVVRPGGSVVIEVPAASALFDVYDRALMHCRRYDMPALVALVRGAGFEIERQSHLGFFVYPAFYLSKRLNQMRYPTGSAADDQKVVERTIRLTGKFSRIMHGAMAIERMLRRYVYLPFGVRCLMTCRKPAVSRGH